MMTKPFLSLAMMVKNEERFLEDALLSARDWVDEMIVVDTGSTDRTVEIARDLGATVSFFPWVNHFSLARNETIKRSNGDWIVILDADERFRSSAPHHVRDLLREDGVNWPYKAILLNIINQTLSGQETHTFYSPRIFPKHSDIGYVGRIHNCFGSISKQRDQNFDFIKCKGLEIVHLGYDQEIYREKKKVERNIEMLEFAVREEPEVLRYRFYLGREYLGLHRHKDAQRLLKQVIDQKENIDRFTYYEACVTYLESLHHSKASVDERLEMAIMILEENEHEADTWYFLFLAYQELGLTKEAMESLEQGLLSLHHEQIQTSRLRGQRGKYEVMLGEYYHSVGEVDRARDHIYHAYAHTKPKTQDRLRLLPLLCDYLMLDRRDDLLKDLLVELGQLADMGFVLIRKLLDHLVLRGQDRLAKRLMKYLISSDSRLMRSKEFALLMSRFR